MDIKLGYYPILDMVLATRQLFSYERFKPFVSSLENINNKLNDDEKELIHIIGAKSNDWLDIIGMLIDMTIDGIVSPEEVILTMEKRFGSSNKLNFLQKKDNELISRFIKSLWQNYFNNETARNNKLVFEKTMDISTKIDEYGLMNYLLKITDRVRKIDENSLEVLIKPMHRINFKDIKNVLIMPSVYASRRFTFWSSGLNYIFYISLDSSLDESIEPTEMLLLKTLALNDRTRLKILRILSTGNYTISDVAEKINLNQSTVSRHFKVFKDAGFVDIFSQEGNSIYYSLNLEAINKSLEEILKYIKGKGDDEVGN